MVEREFPKLIAAGSIPAGRAKCVDAYHCSSPLVSGQPATQNLRVVLMSVVTVFYLILYGCGEMVDTADLKSAGLSHKGSSPFTPTAIIRKR